MMIKAKAYAHKKALVERFLVLRMQLDNVGMKVQEMKSMESMRSAMTNTTKMMIAMNKKLKGSNVS